MASSVIPASWPSMILAKTANGLLYIVMEYIEGTDVQQMIAQPGAPAQRACHGHHRACVRCAGLRALAAASSTATSSRPTSWWATTAW
jgi:hypothetical protein